MGVIVDVVFCCENDYLVCFCYFDVEFVVKFFDVLFYCVDEVVVVYWFELCVCFGVLEVVFYCFGEFEVDVGGF